MADVCKKVAWSYESRFQLVTCDGRVGVSRRSHDAIDPSYWDTRHCDKTQDTVKAGGGSIKVWALFIWNGLGPLVKFNQSLAGNDYVKLLGDHLQPFVEFMYLNSDGIFQNDNEPCHRDITVVIGLKNILDNSGGLIGYRDRQT